MRGSLCPGKASHGDCKLKPNTKTFQLSYSLRSRIERVDRRDRRQIVSRIREGCSPLFIACKKGNVEIVEYLVSACDANLEQRGLYEVQDDR